MSQSRMIRPEDCRAVEEMCKIILNYLPSGYNRQDIINLFGPWGEDIGAGNQPLSPGQFRVQMPTRRRTDRQTGRVWETNLSYAFVEFSSREIAEEVLNLFAPGFVDGARNIKFSLARMPSSNIMNTNLRVYNLPPDWEPWEWTAYFSKFGKVITAKPICEQGVKTGSGYVRFDKVSEAEYAINCHKGTNIKVSRVSRIERGHPRRQQ